MLTILQQSFQKNIGQYIMQYTECNLIIVIPHFLSSDKLSGFIVGVKCAF